MKFSTILFSWSALIFFAANACAAKPLTPEALQSRCPDEQVLAKDLMASRSSQQSEGSSQSGSPWIPLDALRFRSSAQKRGFMLQSIKDQLVSRHTNFDLSELDRVLDVMRGIKREKFVPSDRRAAAYLPMSLDIGFCQTLSDAYIIALMTSVAHVGRDANVLDVGTGSGYQAAILSRIARHVQSLEIVHELATQSRRRLKNMGFHNVDVVQADGYAGWRARAPYDVILVTAGSTAIPTPLLDQLKRGGTLIMPVGPTTLQEELVVVTKSVVGAETRCSLGLAAFVPMTGKAQAFGQAPAKKIGVNSLARLPSCFAIAVT